MSSPAVSPRDLPSSLAEIVEAIGIEATLKLVTACGGSAVFVPKDPKPGALVVDAIGVDLARRLAQDFGGSYLDLPTAGRAVTRWLKSLNYTNQEIARLLHCSRKTVERRLGDQPDTRQLGLIFER
jgi:hypothetical protein